MRKSILVIASAGVTALMAGAHALAGYAPHEPTEYFNYSSDAQCEAEKQAKEDDAKTAEPADVKPVGPEPIYFGF